MPKTATTAIPPSSRSRGRSKAAKDSYNRRVRRHLGQPELKTEPAELLPAADDPDRAAAYHSLRSWILAHPSPLSPSDLSRAFRIGSNHATSLLEHLEALRLLGSSLFYGIRRWHPSLPIDEDRVLMLRRHRQP